MTEGKLIVLLLSLILSNQQYAANRPFSGAVVLLLGVIYVMFKQSGLWREETK